MVKTLYDSCMKTTGPVLFNYVCWILIEAHKKGINKLYFLARDGYLLYKIAKKVCAEKNISIECRYLYCSRASLRLPTYHLIGEEAYDLLLLGSYRTSRYSILDKLSLTEEQRFQIYNELGYDFASEKEQLNHEEFVHFTNLLRNNTLYRFLVNEKSKRAYPAAIGYLKQENLLDNQKVAIVDSGWSGTMQRSLRQLLDSVGYTGKIIGFYFGMFRFIKKEVCDGEFNSWYFSPNTSLLNKVLFSNNLFECFLSAPHGMTIGYKYQDEYYQPILKEGPIKETKTLIQQQIEFCLQYVENHLSTLDFETFNVDKTKKETQILLRRIMAAPTKKEVTIYSQFLFCDDISEKDLEALVTNEQYGLLKDNYLITKKIFRKITGASKKHINQEVFWPYGTARFTSNQWITIWYWLNIFLWDLAKFYLHKDSC